MLYCKSWWCMWGDAMITDFRLDSMLFCWALLKNAMILFSASLLLHWFMHFIELSLYGYKAVTFHTTVNSEIEMTAPLGATYIRKILHWWPSYHQKLVRSITWKTTKRSKTAAHKKHQHNINSQDKLKDSALCLPFNHHRAWCCSKLHDGCKAHFTGALFSALWIYNTGHKAQNIELVLLSSLSDISLTFFVNFINLYYPSFGKFDPDTT